MTHVQDGVITHEPTNREIFEVLLTFKERFDGIDGRFDAVDKRLDGMDKRFDGMDKRFDGMDKRFDGMDKRFTDAEDFIGGMKVEMEERFSETNDKITATTDKMTKGFTDVYHKLDDMRNDIRRVDNKVDMAKESLYRLEKRSTEDIVAVGTSLIDLRKKVKKLEGVRVE